MTETAERIMALFKGSDKVKTGFVLSRTELHRNVKQWGEAHAAGLKSAADELSAGGYIIVTPSDGLELTDKGYLYLFGEV